MDQPASTSGLQRQPGKERILPEIKSEEQLRFPHHVLAENNLYAEDIHLDKNIFSLRSTNHLPFLSPNSTGNNGSGLNNWDPVSTLVHEKHCWKERTNYIVKGHGHKYLKSFEELCSEPGNGTSTMPRYMADFLELVDQDPDSEFEGVTNWFYSGGRLHHVMVDGQNILLSSCGMKNENLHLIPLEYTEELGWNPTLSAASKLELPETPIYQIVGKSINLTGLIGIRRRNVCSVYELKSNDECLELCGMHSAKSNNLYTSMDISKEDCGQYCTSGIGRQVTLWDSVRKLCVSSQIVEKPKYNLINPWCSIQFVRRSFSLMLSDACSLNFLDTRITLEKPALTFYPRDSPHMLTPCDDISHVFPSATSDNVIYIATNHHLHQYDPRSVGIVKRWTHMFQSPPLYSQTIAENSDREWICIANQEPGEVEIIANGLPGGNDVDNLTFPFTLPTLLETLHESNLTGRLLNPRVQRRLRASVTGVVLLPIRTSNSLLVLTQTALGDIFTQEVTRASTIQEKDSAKCLGDWENKVSQLAKTPQLYTTNRQDLSSVFQDLQDPKLKLDPYNERVLLHAGLRASKSELKLYKDKLAPELLAAWKIDAQPDWDADCEESDDELDGNLETFSKTKIQTCETNYPEAQSTPLLLRTVSLAKRTPSSAAKRKANVSGF